MVDRGFHCRQVYLQHKAVVLILVWTMIVGELIASEQFLIGGFIESYVPFSSKGLNITLPIQYYLPWLLSMLY